MLSTKNNIRFCPDKKTFLRLARKGNLIPVYTELFADLETPVSAFKKIDDGKFSCLLESVEGQEKIGRYSFLASHPEMVVRASAAETKVFKNIGGRLKIMETIPGADPLEVVKAIMGRYCFVSLPDVPVFCGGMVGFLSYDAVRHFERIADKNKNDLEIPESVFMLTRTLLVFDRLNHKIKIIANAHVRPKLGPAQAYAQAQQEIRRLVNLIRRPLAPEKDKTVSGRTPARGIRVSSNLSAQRFKQMVEKAKRYIHSGDVIQVVLSQRFQANFKAPVFDIYRALRSINPSPYMFFLRFDDFQLIGSSPEILVRCEQGKVIVRPIAGTRPRGTSEREDEKLKAELLADPKERAEHIMLVDLGRNDIGRVCVKGSVRVSELMTIEKYSHVMHIVSNVEGQLAPRFNPYDVLRATFPAGTVSGAPKIRAMEIIDELEDKKRGPYAGCVGYFSFSGNLDSCITIRTILAKHNAAYVQAGAGIVADSIPAREFNETKNKARALIKAIAIAEEGIL